jgi:hypothetical protein
MTNHIVDVSGFEEAICDACIGGPEENVGFGIDAEIRRELNQRNSDATEQQLLAGLDFDRLLERAMELTRRIMAQQERQGQEMRRAWEEQYQFDMLAMRGAELRFPNGSVIHFKPREPGESVVRGCGERRGQTGDSWQGWLLDCGQPLGENGNPSLSETLRRQRT